jgi:hypothetical protein
MLKIRVDLMHDISVVLICYTGVVGDIHLVAWLSKLSWALKESECPDLTRGGRF